MRRHRADGNQASIVKALRSVGVTVEVITQAGRRGAPDLITGFRGQTVLMETKTPSGKISEEQLRWHMDWRGGPVMVVRSVEDALAAHGLVL